jgi:lipoprotein-anchoring transpeptidase ErfK/SrfK
MTAPTSGSRSDRRSSRARRRVAIGAALAVALLAVVGAYAAFGSGGSGEPRAHGASPTSSVTVPATTPVTSAAPAPTGASVATTRVEELQVFDAPGSPNVVTSFTARTEYLAPRTLLVTERQGDWLKALLPMRPNQSEGWIRSSDVTLSENPYRITIDLAAHELVLTKDGHEVLRSGIVGGSPRTPTPLGTYYITDPVDLRDRPNGAYGAYALGLSGYSEVLFEFNGGPGQIAIHGTNNPELIGQDVSNGCIRVPNDVAVEIATQAPLGTPVVIR